MEDAQETSEARARPFEPDTAILDRAAVEASRLLELGSKVEWEVGERLDRRSSVIFHLRAATGDGEMLGAYYKVSIPPPYPGERLLRWVGNIRDGLERCRRLEQRLSDLVADREILFSRAIAVDPASLTTVTLEVPGKPFSKPWRHLATGAKRTRAQQWLAQVGRAVRLIEECSAPETGLALSEALRNAAVERRIGRVRDTLGSRLADSVEATMMDLDRESMAEPSPVVYAHGDLSPTNIVISDRLGLIDFTWPAKVRGFDVAHLAFRLEYDTVAPLSLTRSLTGALLDGYGGRDVGESPGWRLVRLTKLLKIVTEDGGLRDGTRKRRALSEIESTINSR